MPLTSKKEPAGVMKVRDSLDCREMLEFKIPREKNRIKNRIAILDFMTADFKLSRDLLGGISWDIIMREK